jgi:hypothetical protein
MKLSQVIAYLNMLESSDMDPTYGNITDKLDDILHAVKNRDLQYHSTTADLDEKLVGVKDSISKFDQSLQSLKQQLRNDVDRLAPSYYAESWKRYEQEMCFETVEHLINRKLSIEFDDYERLRNVIKNYTDWRLPGMVLGSRQETFVEDMVPMDPLYLVDHTQELLNAAMKPFTQEYQRRLRPYVINDWKDTEILTAIPPNQFGLVFAYNYFNWKPIEMIERFLIEIYQKLRPGGALIFTYNECDNWYGVGAVENAWMCYTPGSRIQTIAKNLGYKIINRCTGAGDIAWFEMRKPGEIRSLRGGQVLARVIRRE